MRILGIDPGLASLGWGIIDMEGSKITHIAHGDYTSSAEMALSARLAGQYRALSDVIKAHRPMSASIEETFVNKDAKNTLKLGQARGVALMVPALFGLDVGEYAPNRIKKTLTGAGHASKDQMAYMLKIFFPGLKISSPHAADALAVAICHAHYRPARRLKAVGE